MPYICNIYITLRAHCHTDIARTISYICKGVSLSQPRLLHRAIRQNASIRRRATRELLDDAIRRFVPSNNPSFGALTKAVARIPPGSISKGEIKTKTVVIPETSILPEVEVLS